ncbi:hypothetical protein [Amycolatopsis samaneae]|uniref:Uncharacterized protein n=1 Tax=Amycolatopsis samaneae TaxID=664691 RepID=A0ABW5G7V2_9PSEU
MRPTITINEANTRVEDYASRAVKALPSQAKLTLTYEERHGDCSDPTDHGPKNRVVANRSYQVLGLDSKEIPSYFAMLRSWWLANNFRVLDETPPNEFLWVENNADGFQMTLKANFKGEIYLLAGSPCVWPNGTPEATAAGQNPAEQVVAQQAPAPKSAPRRRPAADEYIEDFDQTDWTDEQHY